MEPKVRYKLRSSLKKTKPRNPAGSFDNSDSDDTGIIPPLRRVSFASSNYVKPFLDDPEKNTIWDNTYEEEVNHTDSTKSDTNNLLESKSHICNIPNTIHDQSMVNMEFTCLDHTLKIESLRNKASETSVDNSCSLRENVKNKNMTVFEADLEFTCQWKNNIIELNQFQNLPINQGNLEKNTTTYQEESMSMTCRCLSSNQSKRIHTEDKENMIMTATGCNTFGNRKENISLKESRMEFTCVLPSNIVGIDSKTTTINTENKENIYGNFASSSKFNNLNANESNMEFTCLLPTEMDNHAKASSGENKENMFFIGGTTGTKSINDTNKENTLLPDNIASCLKVSEKESICSQNDSEMEFTCLIPNNILKNYSETKDLDKTIQKNLNRSKPTLAMHFENEESIPFHSNLASYSKPVFSCPKVSKKVIYSQDDSDMEFTCLIPNNILKNEGEIKDTTNKENIIMSKPAPSMHFDNKENIQFFSSPPSCSEPVVSRLKVSEKDIYSQNDSEMEFTCLIPNNIVKNDSETKDLDTTHKTNLIMSNLTQAMYIENTENIPFLSNLASSSKPTFDQKNNIIESNQSKMDFTYKLPNQMLKMESKPKTQEETEETIKQHKELISNTNKENVQNVVVPDVLLIDNEQKNILCQNIEEKENLLDADCASSSKTNVITKETSYFQSKTTDSLPKKALQMRVQSPEIKENALILTNTDDSSVNIANKFNEHRSFSVSKIYACPKDKLDELPQPEKADASYSNSEVSLNIIKKYTTTNNQNTFKEPKVIASQTKCIPAKNKPFKIKEFGNIPIAVDITDLSIDQCQSSICPKDKLDELLEPEKVDGFYSNPELSQNIIMEYTTTNSQNTFKEPEVIASQTKGLPAKRKPLKIKEFGNIPIAVDITDLSIDQNIHDHSKDLPPSISTENHSLKERTYTIPKVNSQLNNTPGFMRNTNINEMTYSIHQDEMQTMPKPAIHETISKTEDDKIYSDRRLVDDRHKVLTKCPTAFSGKNTDESICYDEKICMENKEIERMSIIRQAESPLTYSLKKENENINLSTEECSLIDSTLPSLHEGDFDDLEASLQNKMKDVYTGEEGNNLEIQRDSGLNKISPKIIYSEPIKTVSGEFPSMHTTIYPLNFSNVYSIEDTQQLIQATFSKPSDSIDFENSNNSNSEIEAANMPQKCIGPGIISIDKNAFQNESIEVQSIFTNIKEKLINYEYEDVNYDEIRKSIKCNKIVQNKMKKLLQNFSLPEFHVPNLEARRRKMSLPSVSVDGNSSDSFLYSEEDNYDKSVIIEPIISLHEKIVNLCDRSNEILSVQNFKDDLYVFSSFYDCLRIFVSIHPEDHRVTEIKTKSLLQDSADPIYHFLIKKTMDKLKHSSLKSYLGSYFDVLTLLDHIWLTVEDVINFHYEFLSLQKLYPTLSIHPDLYLCLEILQEHPPTWCKIRFDMTSVTKVNSESLQVETIIGSVNQEHLKKILRDVNEGVDSLKNLSCNIYKYFKISVKTLESIKLF